MAKGDAGSAGISPAGGISGFFTRKDRIAMKRNKREDIRLSAVICAVVTATLAVAAAAAMAAYIIHDKCRRALPMGMEREYRGEHHLPVFPDDEELEF